MIKSSTYSTDPVDIPMDGAPRRANSREQGRVRAHSQEEGARNVPDLRLRQGDIPLRRTAEEVPARAVPATHATTLT